MRVLVAAALTAAFAAPSFADTLGGDAKLTSGAALLAAIEKDEGKRRAYCDLQRLLTKAEQAMAGKNEADARTFSNQAEARSRELGDDFLALMAMQIDVDPSTAAGKEYFAAWESLEKSCPKS